MFWRAEAKDRPRGFTLPDLTVLLGRWRSGQEQCAGP